VHRGIVSPKDWTREVKELMDRVGMNPDYSDRYPHQFSGGQRQRIGIARALALRPRLIICDEAVSALDVSVQAQVLNLLQDLQADLGLSYLFISHDLSVIEHICDRVLVLNKGVVVEEGTALELFENPQDEYTRALLSAVPVARPWLIEETP
jgi:ABC-type oligopeptide transport system ATPase subunit